MGAASEKLVMGAALNDFSALENQKSDARCASF